MKGVVTSSNTIPSGLAFSSLDGKIKLIARAVLAFESARDIQVSGESPTMTMQPGYVPSLAGSVFTWLGFSYHFKQMGDTEWVDITLEDGDLVARYSDAAGLILDKP